MFSAKRACLAERLLTSPCVFEFPMTFASRAVGESRHFALAAILMNIAGQGGRRSSQWRRISCSSAG